MSHHQLGVIIFN